MTVTEDATARISKRRIETFKFKVAVTQADIDNGKCRYASQCMEKVAVARTLMTEFGAKSDAELRVRVDAGHMKFNFRGYHWIADTPKIARQSLILFDQKKPVEPHSYVVSARRGAAIKKISRVRQDQINAARIARICAGNPDKPSKRMSLRKRVVGFT
jgi:hypothetical protein